jgi:hypothetical protein
MKYRGDYRTTMKFTPLYGGVVVTTTTRIIRNDEELPTNFENPRVILYF